MRWTQVVVAVALLVYIGAFVGAMVAVRRSSGANPKGHARGHALGALLNGLASLLLLATAIAYPLHAGSVDWFGRIAHLDHPAARGLGVASLALAGVCLIWGEVSLGRSFRVALPESVQPLITHGIYRFIRNPLAVGRPAGPGSAAAGPKLAGVDQSATERLGLPVQDPDRGGLPARGARRCLCSLLPADRALSSPVAPSAGSDRVRGLACYLPATRSQGEGQPDLPMKRS